ncbi:Uncharacterised protein [Streptococcus suis]|uniref:Uncharacterized protein n=1 Tax=Streptococcus suis TaxID=1307 RepID=A0A0Z8GCM8_STRSU|nr:Uncharacterised protein [Streptococcus suis]
MHSESFFLKIETFLKRIEEFYLKWKGKMEVILI